MSEGPILYTGAMVREVLGDRKTQTRRVIKLREFGPSDTPGYDWTFRDRRGLWNDMRTADLVAKKCPYGQPGELLWVRETWAASTVHDSTPPRELPRPCAVFYRERDGQCDEYDFVGRWRPSIHMPRWASRLTLRVTDVRIERVQAASDADIAAEGLRPSAMGAQCSVDLPGGLTHHDTHIECWRLLWDSINGKREGCSWEANPWVWVVCFERVET
ncbi:MAG: hypothetical protein JJ863_21590 [Deltaproteobacteria bacterium]|nr:hypothetical protein [Deltaproteobacteria bacterium]